MERTKTSINPYGLPNITIPAEVLFNNTLSWSEKALFGFVNNFSYNDKGYCWASNKHLAQLMNVRSDTISTMLSKLQKEHFIIMEYEKRYDGMQVRKVFIDQTYITRYSGNLLETFGKLNHSKSNNNKKPLGLIPRGVGQNPKGGRAKSQGGLGKIHSNIDIDIKNDIKIKDIGRNDKIELLSGIKEKKSNISPDQFEEFWKLYPKKVGKKDVQKKWEVLSRKPIKEQPLFQDIVKAIQEQSKSDQWQDSRYIPNPTTWLNQERWNDELLPARKKKGANRKIAGPCEYGSNVKVVSQIID